MLPMMYDPTRHCKTISLVDGEEPWEDPRKVKDELLWPQRFSRDYVDNRLKKFLRTTHNIECQLQQNPSSMTGGIFKREWFKLWKHRHMPDCEAIIQSWDTALSTEIEACESACTTWGIFKDGNNRNNIILLNCVSVRLPHHELRRFITEHAKKYAHDRDNYPTFLILIESAANGKALVDDLKRTGLPIMGFSPQHHGLKNEYGQKATSKIGRAHLASTLVEQRLVHLPMRSEHQLYPFADKFLTAALSFPSKGKDIVDSMSQAFIKIIQLQGVHYVGEEPMPVPINWKEYEENHGR
jgi:phage terminase large subunit-like protein